MNKHTQIIVTVCALFLFSCKERWQKAIEKVDQSLLYRNDHRGWELVREDNSSQWDIKYTLKKNDNDTSKVLFFLEGKDGSIEVNGYKKHYPCNAVDTCYLEMTSQDTLFFYREYNDKKIFKVGEYAYLFTYMKMDSSEANYYLKHEDSLKRIRGSNLPKLPR